MDFEIIKAKKLLESKGYKVIKIHEMSSSWKDIKLDLMSGKTREVFVHLLRIYFWSDITDSKSHWVDEIYSFFHSISKLKGSNKYPKEDKIFSQIWDAWGDTWDALKGSVEEDHEDLPQITIDDESIEFCKEYILWLSKELSMNGKVTKKEIVDKIEEILRQRRN